jgi:protein-disulfide isomerase
MSKLSSLILVSLMAASTALAQTGSRSEENCGCEDKPIPELLSIVNGVKITVKDLDPDTHSRIAELKRQVIEARKLELDLQINSMLLEAEAKKRKMPASKILEEEVITKTQQPTETEARNFFNEQKARIKDSSGARVEFEQVKDRIMAYLREQRQQELAKKFAEGLRRTADLKVLVDSVTPPAKPSDRQRLFAIVNSQQITSAHIEDSLQPIIYGVQEQMYELRRRDLNGKINDVLLAQEAQKRQVTMRGLLDAEVDSKVPAVTETEALKFYNSNKDRMNGAFTDVKDQIVRFLQNAETDKLQVALAEGLRKTAKIEDFLTPPEPPVYAIATDDQPTKGDGKAPITLVEFIDFQCPTCGQLQPVLERLVQEYNGRVRLVARDYPLLRHENAFKAAEAAEAAREQDKYWEYSAKLFSNQSALGIDKLKQYAGELGLDQAKFNAALDGQKYKFQVQRDVLDGSRVGIRSTPTLFINGKRVEDRSYEGLKRAIDAMLSATK